MAEVHGQFVTSIVKREEKLAGLSQLLELVASSTDQQEGLTGGAKPGPGGLAGAAALPGQVGQAGRAGEFKEACPALRNRWSRLKPNLRQGLCFSWCPCS